jgi:hypothetical protein
MTKRGSLGKLAKTGENWAFGNLAIKAISQGLIGGANKRLFLGSDDRWQINALLKRTLKSYLKTVLLNPWFAYAPVRHLNAYHPGFRAYLWSHQRFRVASRFVGLDSGQLSRGELFPERCRAMDQRTTPLEYVSCDAAFVFRNKPGYLDVVSVDQLID